MSVCIIVSVELLTKIYPTGSTNYEASHYAIFSILFESPALEKIKERTTFGCCFDVVVPAKQD
jgi:hypothetical protein